MVSFIWENNIILTNTKSNKNNHGTWSDSHEKCIVLKILDVKKKKILGGKTF